MSGNQKIILRKEPKLESKFNAYTFQKEAFNAVKDLNYCAIFHEQGLGKTKIAIDLMLYWLNIKSVDTVLFVVKKNLIHNWKAEFESHTHIKPKILSQNKTSNFYTFNSPSRVILTHYEVCSTEINRFKLFLKARNVAVVLDESTKIKNPFSKITKSFFQLSKLSIKRVIMTGTPIANRTYDIWCY